MPTPPTMSESPLPECCATPQYNINSTTGKAVCLCCSATFYWEGKNWAKPQPIKAETPPAKV